MGNGDELAVRGSVLEVDPVFIILGWRRWNGISQNIPGDKNKLNERVIY
jgi:hypothetical protein